MSHPRPLLPAAFTLATENLTRTSMHRVYWAGQAPLFPSLAKNNRYDCSRTFPLSAQFSILYLGYDLTTCWMETVVRHNMIRPAGTDIRIPKAKLTNRWACEVTSTHPLTLAQFSDEPLIDLGECASHIMDDSYLRTQYWSQLLHAHTNPVVDGIRYRSRFNSGTFCIALFERAIIPRGLVVSNMRNIDAATSHEAQSIMKRFMVVPI